MMNGSQASFTPADKRPMLQEAVSRVQTPLQDQKQDTLPMSADEHRHQPQTAIMRLSFI